MKLLPVIISFTFVSLCHAENQFDNFLNQFRVLQPPFALDCNYMEMFPHKKWNDNIIDRGIVQSFISKPYDPDLKDKSIIYRHGVRYQYQEKHICFVSKLRSEPGGDYHLNELNSLIIVIYDKNGKQLSQATIAKFNDMYFAKCFFLNDSTIRSVQTENAKKIPIDTEEVYVDVFEYKIARDGSISQKRIQPRRKGAIIEAENKKRYREIIIDSKIKW